MPTSARYLDASWAASSPCSPGSAVPSKTKLRVVDMDSVQYHPTGAAFPQQIKGCLVTEKVRGLGAMPVNAEGNAFVYPLEPVRIRLSP